MDTVFKFLLCFIVIYVIYYIIVVNRKKGIESFKNGKQLEFFKTVYKLDARKLNIKKFANTMALTNAFIMSITICVMDLIDNLILKMLIGFVLIVVLMLSSYKMLGSYYKKKEGK